MNTSMDPKLHVNFAKSSMSYEPLKQGSSEVKIKDTGPSTETSSDPQFQIRSKDAVIADINKLPETRPDKVALGKKLLNDENYPSSDQLGKLASALLKDVSLLE